MARPPGKRSSNHSPPSAHPTAQHPSSQSSAWRRYTATALKALTTPLVPADIAGLVDPLRGRELRGKVERVEREGPFVTLYVRPGPNFPTHFAPGQFLGLGVRIDGRWTWRSYSLTSAPVTATNGTPTTPKRRGKSEDRGGEDRGLISVSIKPLPGGRLSNHVAQRIEPGDLVRLTSPGGDFHLPHPVPETLIFLTAGSGITPIISMLRWLAAESAVHPFPDVVHIHSERAPAPAAPFGDELAALSAAQPRYRLLSWDSADLGRLTGSALGQLLAQHVPDAAHRAAFACGPQEFLDAVAEHLPTVTTEQFFAPVESATSGSGGRIRFGTSGVTADAPGSVSILDTAEAHGVQLVHGCRMGICRTCVTRVISGEVLDMRDGARYGPGEHIRTCCCVPCGDAHIAAG